MQCQAACNTKRHTDLASLQVLKLGWHLPLPQPPVTHLVCRARHHLLEDAQFVVVPSG